MRGATGNISGSMKDDVISTHAPHARCDVIRKEITEKAKYFYSRTSCEVRLSPPESEKTAWIFLLTHLMRGATKRDLIASNGLIISTHAPHARCDKMADLNDVMNAISTHAPHARCDEPYEFEIKPNPVFLLTHLMRGATSIH